VKDVHDLFGLLPGGAIRALEQAEIDWREEPAISLWSRWLLRVHAGLKAGLKTALNIEEDYHR
jgi:hypothetical protein